TMTTVGYGDLTPVSEGGRLLTVLMILTGIALVPWQVGDLIQRLVRSQTSREIACNHCGLAFHEADAAFCRRCGTSLKQEAGAAAIDLTNNAIDRDMAKNTIAKDITAQDITAQDIAAKDVTDVSVMSPE
ncbi:MAG: ion channel, partial [Cyanobacteria bacterium P01_E01_bin.34]